MVMREQSVSEYWPECGAAVVKQYMKPLPPLDSPALLSTGGGEAQICCVLGDCDVS